MDWTGDLTVLVAVFSAGFTAGFGLAAADVVLAGVFLSGIADADLTGVALTEAVLTGAVLAGVDLAVVPVDAVLADAVLRAGALVVFATTGFVSLAGVIGCTDLVDFTAVDADLADVVFLAAGFFADVDFDAVLFIVADSEAATFVATGDLVVFAAFGVAAFAFGRPGAFAEDVFVAGLGFGAVAEGFKGTAGVAAFTVGVFLLGAFVVLVLAVAKGFSTGWIVLGVLVITLFLADHL